MHKAIIITPTYNERENIQVAVAKLVVVFKKIKHWQMGVLVVDDSSPDGTADVVKELQKTHRQLYLLVNPKKSGLGGAYLKGMEYAFDKLNADVVFEFDADLSHDPEKIPLFLDAIDHGADMVLGSRYIKGGGIPEDWGWHRKFLSVVGNWIICVVLADFRIRDWTGGYRAITKPVYKAVEKEMHSDQFTGYTFQMGFLHKTVRKGFTVVEVPFQFIDRTIGQSKLGSDSIINTLMYLLKTRAKEILNSRILKFLVVGGLGALIQLLSVYLYRRWLHLPYQAANAVGIETAVLSNFILSNLWTFRDRALEMAEIPLKFIQFNLASMGSILIQLAVAWVGQRAFGLIPLGFLTFGLLPIDTGELYVVVGILIGMVWNFLAYDRLIWRAKK